MGAYLRTWRNDGMQVKKIGGAIVAIMVAGIAILGAVQLGLIKGKALPVDEDGDGVYAPDLATTKRTDNTSNQVDTTAETTVTKKSTGNTNSSANGAISK
jgi:hypothetical protein